MSNLTVAFLSPKKSSPDDASGDVIDDDGDVKLEAADVELSSSKRMSMASSESNWKGSFSFVHIVDVFSNTIFFSFKLVII